MSFQSYSESRVQLINSYLDGTLQKYRSGVSQRFAPLIDAMQYSLEGGGKRLRPLLLLASAECLGISAQDVLPAACAIEFVHTYSLIQDDLPAMDDDDFRRGKPANHKKFGEAVSLLASDALLTEAFGQLHKLADSKRFESKHVLAAMELLVNHSGLRGMLGGQLLDVTTEHPNYSLPEIEFIHIHKTGAMIVASILLPARLILVEDSRLSRLRRYGEAVGLAFQISDDLLDTEASLRYSRGPRKKPKPSYTQLMSPAEMKTKMNGLVDAAIQAVEGEGSRAKALIDIAEFIRTRKN